MNRRRYVLNCVAGLAIAMLSGMAAQSQTTSTDGKAPAAMEAPHLANILAGIPLMFEPNVGQANAEVKFLSRGPGYSLSLTSNQALFAFRSSVLGMSLVDGNPSTHVEALEQLPTKTFYYIGNDASRWHKNVPNFAKVKYRDIYPNVDLAYYGNPRELEYDFIVHPGANPAQIKLAVEGFWKPTVNADGELLLSGNVRWRRPVAYQEIDGKRRDVAARFVRLKNGTFGFRVGDYDRRRALVIDPVLNYSTYLGDSGTVAAGVAVDSGGNAWLVGSTPDYLNFPFGFDFTKTVGPLGNSDVYVAEIIPGVGSERSLSATFFLGGSGDDHGNAIAIDSNANVYVAGDTQSNNFPLQLELELTGGSLRGPQDGFVTEFDQYGNLLFSTYLGAAAETSGTAIAVSNGAVYLAGYTFDGSTFPTQNAFASSCPTDLSVSAACAFVSKIVPNDRAMLYSTYLGPSAFGTPADSRALAIAADGAERAYVAGYTSSLFFPVAGAYQSFCANSCKTIDTFVSVLDTNQAGDFSLLYSTYLGGGAGEIIYAITLGGPAQVGNTNDIIVAGTTGSVDFPTVNAYQNASGGSEDGFISILDPTIQGKAGLLYSTYLGGSNGDEIHAIASANGMLYASGETGSVNFPVKNAINSSCGTDGQCNGANDAFITELNPSVAGTNGLVFSTYLGGEKSDFGTGIAVDSQGSMLVAGSTQSALFPTTPINGVGDLAFQSSLNGTENAFFAQITDPHAALSITKTVPSTASAGSILAYTIVITNSGPSSATNVTLTDALPAGTTLNALPIVTVTGPAGSSTPSDWTCTGPPSGSTGTVSCSDSQPVANGETDTFLLKVNVSPSLANGTVMSNTAAVSSITTNPNPANETSTATVTVTNVADVQVGKAASSSTVKSGGTVTYTVTVTNNGPNTARGVTMTDSLPSVEAFAGGLTTTAGSCTAPPVGSGGTVSCNLSDIAANKSVTIRFAASIAAANNKSSVTNTASAASAYSTDPNTANNSASVSVLISGNKK